MDTVNTRNAKAMPVIYMNWLASCGVASSSSLLVSLSSASNSDVSEDDLKLYNNTDNRIIKNH